MRWCLNAFLLVSGSWGRFEPETLNMSHIKIISGQERDWDSYASPGPFFAWSSFLVALVLNEATILQFRSRGLLIKPQVGLNLKLHVLVLFLPGSTMFMQLFKHLWFQLPPTLVSSRLGRPTMKG